MEKEKISEKICNIAKKVPDEGLSLEEIILLIGEYGVYFTSMILIAPFLFPVSFPGSSTPFSIMIILLNLRIFFSDRTFLPKRIGKYHIEKESLLKVFKFMVKIIRWLENIFKPRFFKLADYHNIKYINSFIIIIMSILLMFPLPVPLTDFFPAYAILTVTLGTLERDGYAMIVGYCLCIFTMFYFYSLGYIGINLIKEIIYYFI